MKRFRSSRLSSLSVSLAPSPTLFLVAACLLLLCGGGFFGCAEEEPTSPVEEVRALLAEAELAAETKDIKVIKEMISANYADTQGRAKDDLKQVLAYHFLRNQSLHLAVRVDSIALLPSGEVEGVLFVAMANTPISSLEELANLRAAMYRFDFRWIQEGGKGKDWKLIQSSWRRANNSDFLE